MNLDEIVQKAKELGSYFITITTKDKKKEENDLDHYVFRQEFPIDDTIPSLDACVKSMGVKLEKPVDVIIPSKLKEYHKLKIAIISHFNSMPAWYSPARAVRNQIKMLKEHGHEVTIFLQEGSPLTDADLGCNIKRIMPKFKREKNVVNEDIKNKIIDIFRTELTDNYDCIITHDFFLQDTITYSEAIRQCGVKIMWINFARSGVAHNMDFSMPNARFCYLNRYDLGKFARAIKVDPKQCRTVYNEKDISYMFNFHPVSRFIIDNFKLWERDIIMTYPVCSTRLSAKNLNSVIRVFVELKRLGKKVCLIVANSNGRRRVDDLKRTKELANEMGLNDDEFIFTSLLTIEGQDVVSGVTNKVCAELMQISNLFIMASAAEVGPNIWYEAAMTKNLLVANSDLPLLYDFIDKDKVLSFPFSSKASLHYSNNDESYQQLAKQIIGQLQSNKADLSFRQIWRNHNAEAVYSMLMDVLVEAIEDYKQGKL